MSDPKEQELYSIPPTTGRLPICGYCGEHVTHEKWYFYRKPTFTHRALRTPLDSVLMFVMYNSKCRNCGAERILIYPRETNIRIKKQIDWILV